MFRDKQKQKMVDLERSVTEMTVELGRLSATNAALQVRSTHSCAQTVSAGSAVTVARLEAGSRLCFQAVVQHRDS